MAICRPKAIHDAPTAHGPHRTGAMGWALGRSAAEDGGGRLSCFARNGQTGVPARLVAWGGKPRGRKLIRPPLRLRRSRRSRPSARSSHGEAMWSAHRTASSGEDVAKVDCLAEDVLLSRRTNGNPSIQKGAITWPCPDCTAAKAICPTTRVTTPAIKPARSRQSGLSRCDSSEACFDVGE
jgi:hypothetical protein